MVNFHIFILEFWDDDVCVHFVCFILNRSNHFILSYNQTNPYKYILPNFNPCTENLLLVLPFYHMYGMSIVTSALMEGYTVVAIQQFSLELYCQCIQDFKVRSPVF
jgi:acyl-CoA synthetase (AMP-forming)/AMP-acid ligase II